MRNTENYAGKRVLVVGMARSGIAAAQLLCSAMDLMEDRSEGPLGWLR